MHSSPRFSDTIHIAPIWINESLSIWGQGKEFYCPDGDYYLVIPRYEETVLKLYRNDLETSQPILIYENPDCGPFILQCNVSDIFADTKIQFTWDGETVEFSPFISLKDGSVDIGAQGLDLTRSK